MGGLLSNETDHEWAVSTFRERRAAIEKADPAVQLAFQITLAIYWKAFIAQHGSPARFAQLGRDEQMQYFKKMLALQVSLFDQKILKRPCRWKCSTYISQRS
jgi:hypothetical protein